MDSSKSPYNPHSNAKTETSTHPPLLSDSTTHTQYPEDALQPVTNSMHDTNIDSNSRMDIAPSTNGFPDTRDMNDNDFPSLEELEKELPFVGEGQVHLGLVIHQMVQDLYASLLNIAETLGRAPDLQKKTRLQAWLQTAYKQSSKLYVLAKWSRSAEDIQLALNVAAFLRTQGEQILWSTRALHTLQSSLHRLRIRNPDLLTSLSILTTGRYERLPSHWSEFIPPPPLTRPQIHSIFSEIEDVMRYRLVCKDIVPTEVQWRVEKGRTWMRCRDGGQGRFEASLILTGGSKEDMWAYVGVEFLFGVKEDAKGRLEFPRRPPKVLSDELAFQIRDVILMPTIQPTPIEQPPPPTSTGRGTSVQPRGQSLPPRGQSLPPRASVPPEQRVVDAPLVRVYNFLHLFSLSYQLEILLFQAQQLREFGWKDSLRISVSGGRKGFVVTYWVRSPHPLPPNAPRPPPAQLQTLMGGELQISIVPETSSSSNTQSSAQLPLSSQPFSLSSNHTSSSKSSTSAIDKVKEALQSRLKLKGARPSDTVEKYRFEVSWRPQQGALGVFLPPTLWESTEEWKIDSNSLDFEGLLTKVLRKHADAIIRYHLETALHSQSVRQLFPGVEDVRGIEDGTAIRIQLAGSQYIKITLSLQTGKFIISESGDLGAAQRGVRWAAAQQRVNKEPAMLLDLCARLRHTAILELVYSRAHLLGIPTFTSKNLTAGSVARFGPNFGIAFCQLVGYRNHFLTVVVKEGGFGFALIHIEEVFASEGEWEIVDFGWVQATRVGGFGRDDDKTDPELDDEMEIDEDATGEVRDRKRKHSMHDSGRDGEEEETILKDPFDISVRELRDLHAYCRARVAHTFIESQLKARNIPYIQVASTTHRDLPAIGSVNAIPSVNSTHNSNPLRPTSRHVSTSQRPKGLFGARSPLEEHLPVLCVQTKDILAGAAAAEAAMPNVRIEPTEWWSLERVCGVQTKVRLKYVQPLDAARQKSQIVDDTGKRDLIKVSENITYDARTSVVTFLSRRVEECVDEFLKEWERVSRVVVIARQVSLMPSVKGWSDVHILSFDLQTVEFAYFQDYSMSITSVEGTYRLSFSRCSLPKSKTEGTFKGKETTSPMKLDNPTPPTLLRRNAHADCVCFARSLLKDDRLGASVYELISFLRNSVGIVEVLDAIEDAECQAGKARFDVLVKAAGWWRLRYGDYALDVRMMSGRFVVLDGSVELSKVTAGNAAVHVAGPGVLLPIPKMVEYAKTIVEQLKGEGMGMDGVVPMNYGSAIICGCKDAPRIVRGLHEMIVAGQT